jgi:hypothetical protein
MHRLLLFLALTDAWFGFRLLRSLFEYWVAASSGANMKTTVGRLRNGTADGDGRHADSRAPLERSERRESRPKNPTAEARSTL